MQKEKNIIRQLVFLGILKLRPILVMLISEVILKQIICLMAWLGQRIHFMMNLRNYIQKRDFGDLLRIIQSYLKIYLMMILTMLQENMKELRVCFLSLENA